MRMAPALLEAARLLAMPSLALYQAVQEELVANPALDEVESERPCATCGGPVVGGLCLRCHDIRPDRGTSNADDGDRLLLIASPQGPADDLLADLRASLPASEHSIALALVGSLDDHGFLTVGCDEI